MIYLDILAYALQKNGYPEGQAELEGAAVTGLAAGLHAIVRLDHAVDGMALLAADRKSVV